MGWIHLWTRREAYEEGQPSEHFFNGRTDPRWLETPLEAGIREAMERGDLVEIEDPGYFTDSD